MRIRLVQRTIAVIILTLLFASFVFVQGASSCSTVSTGAYAAIQCSAQYLTSPSSIFFLDDTAALPNKMVLLAAVASILLLISATIFKLEGRNALVRAQKFQTNLPRSFIRSWIDYPSYLYSTQDP